MPIISTPVDGLKDIVKNGENGYLLEKNEEFCEVTIDILNDVNKYEDMKTKSLYMFDKFNNLKNYKNKIREIYENE